MNSLEDKIFNLSDTDFINNNLKSPDCTLVLFYNDINQKDRDLYTIWQIIARYGTISNFAAVNLRIYPKLNFLTTNYPLIAVYYNHHLYTVYHGPHEFQDIMNYALSLSCDTNFDHNEGLRKYSRSY